MLTASHLREILHYEPSTGEFRWLVSHPPRGRVGKIAGWQHGITHYWRIRIDGRLYQGHRLAWLYMTGEWPKQDIDHINGDRADNRWSNLRDVTNAQNIQNQRKAQRNSRSGYLGVVPYGKRWSARITKNGVIHPLGTFDSPQLAHDAYISAKRLMHDTCSI